MSAPQALASHSETVFFEGSSVLLNPKLRAKAIGQMSHLGVKAVRVVLYWNEVAPSPKSTRRPNFEATNPAAYNWGGYDCGARQGQGNGLAGAAHGHLGPVPKWATSTHRDYVTRPDPAATSSSS